MDKNTKKVLNKSKILYQTLYIDTKLYICDIKWNLSPIIYGKSELKNQTSLTYSASSLKYFKYNL